MAHFILIQGKRNSGKTTTAGLVYKELVKICESKHIFRREEVNYDSLRYHKNGATRDFTAILLYGTLKICIATCTDKWSDAEERLNYLMQNNVDIVITCIRMIKKKNSTYKKIFENYLNNKSQNTYEFIKIQLPVVANDNYVTKLPLVDEIISIIKNKI